MPVSTGATAHLRVLNVSPQPRHDKLSCHLVPSVRVCMGSLLSPRAYCGLLMHPLPWTRAQKAAQARQARREARCRPPPLYLLSQGVQPEPAQQPTAHHQRLGGVARTSVRRCVVGSSGSAHATSRARTVASTLTRGVLRICLRRSHCGIFLQTSAPCHRARERDSTAAGDQVPVSSVGMSRSPPATASVGVVSVRPAFGAWRRARQRARRGAVGSSLVATSRTGYRCPAQRHQPRHSRSAPPRCRSQRSTWQGWPASVSRGKVAGWLRTTTSACWRTAVATRRR